MKKTLFITAVLIAFSFQSAVKSPEITGQWKWTNPEDVSDYGFMIFGKDKIVTLIQGEDSLGGPNFYFEEKDEWVKLTYTVDTKPSPHHIDWIIVSNKTGKTISSTKGIYDFPNDSTLRLQINLEDDLDERPEAFDEDEAQLFYR